MRYYLSSFAGAIFLLSAQPTMAAEASPRESVLVIGASYAGDHWPTVLDQTNAEASPSRNAMIQGRYEGLCGKLAVALDGQKNVVCQAIAGAMSTDFTLPPFLSPDPNLQVSLPGYDTQFSKGLQECAWNGVVLCKYLVVTLANDGPNAIAPAQQVIDRARNLGMKVIVQASPQWGTFSFQQERDLAITQHGTFWGGVIQNFLQVLPTESGYNAVAAMHRQALEAYPGVIAYQDFYPRGSIEKTLDGVHPGDKLQEDAARIVKHLVNH